MYLKTPSSRSIVADKFLRATVTRYKFELSMIPALLAAALGFVKMALESAPIVEWTYIIVAGLGVVAAVYLYREACSSADLLHRLRESILYVHDVESAAGRHPRVNIAQKLPSAVHCADAPDHPNPRGEPPTT